jgi:hypothetical protein
MKHRVIVPVLFLCILIALAGCTSPQGTPPSGTGSAAGTPAGTGGASLVPGPTDTMPDYSAVTVDVGEKDYLGKIPVIFQGGKGQINTKKIDVKLTRADGSVQTATVGTNKGDETELQGTRGSGSERGQADRVEVWVTMNSGQTYKIVDVLREYRSRG